MPRKGDQMLYRLCLTLSFLLLFSSCATRHVGLVRWVGDLRINNNLQKVPLDAVAISCNQSVVTNPKSFASITFANDNGIEMGDETELKLDKDCQKITRLQLLSGNIGFKTDPNTNGEKSMSILVEGHRFDVYRGGSGGLWFADSNNLKLLVVSGAITLNNNAEKESGITFNKNQECTLELNTRKVQCDVWVSSVPVQ